ncbi:glycosyltransferase family 4 protein [Hymenobacter properus]|uniref:Glycosyltransferase n=1 Tax=Hymenobacter properus TaxID=2791026 RepID=A0A931BF60_9BACT|nr:glycosyltransferase family 4 protein [Hymenobacter properus]MBF9142294.1 glycosyltransferase [Hymenobacter properus]MBR7721101.1 glycosyltransferase [Microvirga sp. SRT04]
MTPTDFSVLLLAWDDADPSVAVLGGAALPPTLPLVYHLAQEQPVLAVFPHLPDDLEGSKENNPAEPATEFSAIESRQAAGFGAQVADAAEPAATEEMDTTGLPLQETAFPNATAGIRRLLTAASEPAAAFTSLLVGLENLTAAGAVANAPNAAANAPAEVQAALPLPATVTAAPALVRSQWPTGIHAPRHLSWSAPAAPYLGASAPAGPPVLLPVPPLIPAPIVREAADLAQAALNWPVGFSPLASPVAAQLLAATTASAETAEEDEAATGTEETEEPSQKPQHGLQPEPFEETTQEIGAAEANDLSAPEDDLTPDAPAEPVSASEAAPAAAALATEPVPEPALTARTPPLDGLNFRMIQYARQAAQLVRDRADFGVIYAPTWPAWLAALEIRNSTRRPLVLYAACLAAEFAGPAERGWLLEVERMALRRARLVLVPDEQVRQQLRQHYGADTGEVRVVPAADEAALQALLQELAAG